MSRILRSLVLLFFPVAVYTYDVIFRPKPLRFIANKFVSLLIPESVELPEGILYLNPDDTTVSGAIALGRYEPFETWFVRSILSPQMTVVNVGANLGYYTLIVAKHVSKVISFEPAPLNFLLLKKNVGSFKNVELYQVAASDKDGEMPLYLSNTSMGGHTLVPWTSLKEKIMVKTVKLDSIVNKADLLIIDVEGAEPLVLAGMNRLLGEDISILMEFSPQAIQRIGHDGVAMLDMLVSRHFNIYNLNESENKLEIVSDFSALSTVLVNRNGHTNLFCTKVALPQVLQ